MQTIYRNTYTTDFTVIKNDILNSELSGLAKAVLIYLLSKPPHWRLRATDIKRFLKCGINKVYRILQELRTFGYIVMQRIQSAVHWFVYDAPQDKSETATSPASSDRDGFHHDGSSDDIVITETPVKTEKPQQHAPEPEPIQAVERQDVVVHCDEVADNHPISTPTQTIDDVPHIAPQHQPTARQALRTLTKEESDAVVVALTLAMSKGSVLNPVGYLLQLVKASKAGAFSPVQAAGGAPVPSLSERLAKERQRQEEAQRRGAMTVEQHARWLADNFGVKTSTSSARANRVSMLRKALS